MQVPIYCSETAQALTIIKLERWAINMLDQGCVYLRFAPVLNVSPTPYNNEAPISDTLAICTVRFYSFKLGKMQSWIGVTDDGETSLSLRSVFLPGQQSEVRQAERDAQARLMTKMLKNLSS